MNTPTQPSSSTKPAADGGRGTQDNELRPDGKEDVEDGTNRRTPDAKLLERLGRQYLQVDGGFHLRQGSHALAFMDAGQRIRSGREDPATIISMFDLAMAKGWTHIEVHGSEAFRRTAWQVASARQLAVDGYRPDRVDQAALADARNALQDPKRALADRARSPDLGAVQRTPVQQAEAAKPTMPAQDPVVPTFDLDVRRKLDVLRARMVRDGAAPQSIDLAVHAVTRRLTRAHVQGVESDHRSVLKRPKRQDLERG